MQKIKSLLSPGKHAAEATHVENVEQLKAPSGQTLEEKPKAPPPTQEVNEAAPPPTGGAPIHSHSPEEQATLSHEDQIKNYDIIRAQQTEPRGYAEDISPRSTPVAAASHAGNQRGMNGPRNQEYSEGVKNAAPPPATTAGQPPSQMANAPGPNTNTAAATSQYGAAAQPPAEPYTSTPEYKEYKPRSPPKTETGQPTTRPAGAEEPKPAAKEEKKRRSSLLNFLRRDKTKKTDKEAEEEAKSQERQSRADIDRQAPIGTAAATTAGAAQGAERHPAGLESNKPFPTQTQPPLAGMTGESDLDRSKSLAYRPRKTTDAPAFSGVLVDTRGSSIAGSSGAGSIANPPGAPYIPPGGSYSAPRETSATDTGPVRVTGGGAPPGSRMESNVPVGAFNWST